MSFSSKSKAINVSPKRNQLIQANKIESTWRCEIKEQAPQLTLLYRCRTATSIHRRKLFLKILQYSQETPVWESIFEKVADHKTCNFIKKEPQHRWFPVNIAQFFILPILKNICKRLLFKFFNGSLLRGPKGLRSKFYDGVMLQRPSHRSSLLLLSRHTLS